MRKNLIENLRLWKICCFCGSIWSWFSEALLSKELQFHKFSTLDYSQGVVKVRWSDSPAFLKLPNNALECWRAAYNFPVEGRPDSLKAFCMKPLLEQRSFAKGQSLRFAGCCWRGTPQSRTRDRNGMVGGDTHGAGLQWNKRARLYDLALVSGRKAQVLFKAPCCFKHIPEALNEGYLGQWRRPW